MTGSRDEFSRTAVASGVAATAIVIEHLAATEIGRALDLSREMDKRLSNLLGVGTICALFALIAQDGDGRGAQVSKLGAITLSCGLAALTCSAAREGTRHYRESQQTNGRLGERARSARDEDEGDGLGAWRGVFGA